MSEKSWADMSVGERREHWAQKLESGEYKQVRKKLRTSAGFCCLGVLCNIVDENAWRNGTDCFEYTATISEDDVPRNDDIDQHSDIGVEGEFYSMPPAKLLRDVGLTYDNAQGLAEHNDGGSSFTDIAALIRSF